MKLKACVVGWIVLASVAGGLAANAQTSGALAGLSQHSNQAYTRYELLAPGSGKFRIIYVLTQDKPGATLFFNPIRNGSVASDETVVDLPSGMPLTFSFVSGAQARTSGFADADASYDYIRVQLSQPVPPDGGEVLPVSRDGRLDIRHVHRPRGVGKPPCWQELADLTAL